ncbi:FadR/GntR family transcriptional regulator [Bosea sp. 2RAB26]|uniref:FadR/GntR family transcriptional regulator n=1 Tax=Bosea sp. 2RAB26 TaxID=3237476 RepID=UPI003F8FC087
MAARREGAGDARRGSGTLAAVISQALRDAIRSGRFRPGEKLPSEAKLTAEHGVSRTVIREAIAALRADGLVDPRQGAGVFVLEPILAPVLPFQNVDNARVSSVIELLELRSPVEVEAAGLAAQRRSPAQEEVIVERHRAIIACIQNEQPTIEADFELHLAIAEATNNPRFVEFLRIMGEGMIPRSALRQPDAERSSGDYLRRLVEEHGRIVAAISNGDVDEAKDAMRVHLNGSQQRYRQLLRQL